MEKINSTLNYYELNSTVYFMSTYEINMKFAYDRFCRQLQSGTKILDLGSGSGRDTKAFIELGYDVSAIDFSPQMSDLSSKYTGVNTKILSIEELKEVSVYD